MIGVRRKFNLQFDWPVMVVGREIYVRCKKIFASPSGQSIPG